MPSSRLRVRRRILRWYNLLVFARWCVFAGLVIALIGGAYRFITRPYLAGALEFVPHVVGEEKSAVGVLGTGVGDIDDDGDKDVVTGGEDGIKVFLNNGEESFELRDIDEARADRIQLIDLDQDGKLDILASLTQSGGAKWYRNNGDVEFSGSFIGTGSMVKAYAGDLDEDGKPDVVTASDEGGVVVLHRWMNQGDGTFVDTVLDATDTGITAVTIGDINGNHYNDIVTGGSKGLQAWETTDGVTWGRRDIEDSKSDTDFTHIVIGDVTGDEMTDIVVGDQAQDEIRLYRNIDNNAFQRITLDGSVDATTVQISDFDEDGDADVIAAGQDDNSVYWFDNNGSEEFSRTTIASNLQSVFSVSVSDIDNDNDNDFVTADHYRGTIWRYERTRAKPVASKPTNIRQASDGSGVIYFDSTISDSDKDPTQLRIQYSVDGDHWYKPWLISVSPAEGSVDLKNSNGYQVGTSNPVDTNDNDSVKVTFVWNTKSVKNTGGPIQGDVGTVQVRVIPRDDTQVGAASYSSKFRVDNTPPQDFKLRVGETTEDTVTLTWDRPKDSSPYTYTIYYGTDHASVLEQRSPVWDVKDDDALSDVETTTTTIDDLEANKTYSFKLFVQDTYGNRSAAPSVKAKTVTPPPTPSPTILPPGSSPIPTPFVSPSPGGTLPPVTTSEPSNQPPGTTPSPGVSIRPTPEESPSPSPLTFPSPSPSPVAANQPPIADAGTDLVVNPSALVVLDGSASYDPDNELLTYSWRQLSGPTIDLVSARTSTPSFSAGNENELYIFALTVRDERGLTATDTVTVATKVLPKGDTTEVETRGPVEPLQLEEPEPLWLSILRPIDIGLFVLAFITTLIFLAERIVRSIQDRNVRPGTGITSNPDVPKGKVIHYKTGRPIVGAQVLIYGSDNKLRSTERTNAKGEFSSFLPAGAYTIDVRAIGFSFASTASKAFRPENGILYSGGKLTVSSGDKPLNITIPMKPAGEEVSSIQMQLLHLWQQIQKWGRMLSWPLFIAGALLNTFLIFSKPGALFLTLEVLYVILVIIKVALEVRVRPAYGLVRDAITHVPLDLAVVRLYEQGTNRVIMTRVADAKGRFFAIPPAGTYTITIAKPGYAVFSKENVAIEPEQDSILQLTADLMPVAPQANSLQQARAAVL